MKDEPVCADYGALLRHSVGTCCSDALLTEHIAAHVSESVLMEGVRVVAGALVHRAIIDKDVNILPSQPIGPENIESLHGISVSPGGIAVIPPMGYKYQLLGMCRFVRRSHDADCV